MEQNPQLPDQHMPPPSRPDDPGHEVAAREGNMVLPGLRSGDTAHATEPLEGTAEQQPDNQQLATGNSKVRALILTDRKSVV